MKKVAVRSLKTNNRFFPRWVSLTIPWVATTANVGYGGCGRGILKTGRRSAKGRLPKASDWVKQRRLYRERHVCVFNPTLLDLPEPLTPEDYVAHEHLLVSLDGSARGFVDDERAMSESGVRAI